jgi:hypothetical protein
MDYETIKILARERGCRATDLIALAPQNDPFYVGKPGEVALAAWFAQLWQRFDYSRGVHIRRVHYQIVSQSPAVLLPNGLPYENTESCWDTLTQASKVARYLGLVDPDAFVDRRTPLPILHEQTWTFTPAIDIAGSLDADTTQFPAFPDLPGYSVSGYHSPQRSTVEIWAEKSTMNDVLIPLCQRYQANLVTGLGELSITSMLAALQRAVERGTPTRILYVSDFDPAGQSMPLAASRKLEYFVSQHGAPLDIRLFPVVLTLEQITRYNLPRTPVKEAERRARGFEARHGAGAVELDALEALYPGTLRRILAAEIERYYDTTLGSREWEAYQGLTAALEDQRQAVVDRYQEEIETLRAAHAQLAQAFKQQMQAYQKCLVDLWHTIERDLQAASPTLEDYPLPEAHDGDERPDSLYDSERSYAEQLIAYKAFQGKATAGQGMEDEV